MLSIVVSCLPFCTSWLKRALDYFPARPSHAPYQSIAVATWLTILLISGPLICFSQKTQRVIVQRSDPDELYVSADRDSSTLFYETIIPTRTPIGVLVLLPGSGEQIEAIKKQITLHTLAAREGLLVVFPALNWGTNKHVAEHQFLDKIFRQIDAQYKIPRDRYILGGFSGGGMVALTYTERANQYKDSTFIVPRAVFGIDPPLDYAQLWHHCQKDVERNFSAVAVQESQWILQSYRKEFGGSPEQVPQTYVQYSIFSYGEPDGGNAQYLQHTPLLLYTEPDILWQLKNRHRDYYDMNCISIAAMINFLQLRGNKSAELVVSMGKGKRLNGSRHPHSWSIMDSPQCLGWIKKQLNQK